MRTVLRLSVAGNDDVAWFSEWLRVEGSFDESPHGGDTVAAASGRRRRQEFDAVSAVSFTFCRDFF